MTFGQSLAIIVPCYNEADRLPVERLVESTNIGSVAVHYYLVNDGSGDRTGEIIDALAKTRPESFTAIQLPSNRGKAEAVRQGMLTAAACEPHYDLIGYMDADLSVDVAEMVWLAEAFATEPALSLVCGARIRKLGSEIDRSFVRHLMGRVFATICDTLLDLRAYDTQCGAKLFRRDVAVSLFSEPFVTRWCFDVELLLRAKKQFGAERFRQLVVEIPLRRWTHHPGSKIKSTTSLTMFLELLSIRRCYLKKSECD